MLALSLPRPPVLELFSQLPRSEISPTRKVELALVGSPWEILSTATQRRQPSSSSSSTRSSTQLELDLDSAESNLPLLTVLKALLKFEGYRTRCESGLFTDVKVSGLTGAPMLDDCDHDSFVI